MNTIPNVLMNYLHSLVDNDPTIIAILLTPAALDWGSVQDITLVSESGITTHRVFGFTPVSAQLDVRHDTYDSCDIAPAA